MAWKNTFSNSCGEAWWKRASTCLWSEGISCSFTSPVLTLTIGFRSISDVSKKFYPFAIDYARNFLSLRTKVLQGSLNGCYLLRSGSIRKQRLIIRGRNAAAAQTALEHSAAREIPNTMNKTRLNSDCICMQCSTYLLAPKVSGREYTLRVVTSLFIVSVELSQTQKRAVPRKVGHVISQGENEPDCSP